MPERPYSGEWYSCDGLYECEIGVLPPDGDWPPMVKFELSYGPAVIGGSFTIEDAKELAAHLGAAASSADLEGRKARAAERTPGE
jgi:hypothetical protein